jgi:hypothetical protein
MAQKKQAKSLNLQLVAASDFHHQFLERQYHPTGLLSVGRESAIYVVDKGETFLIGES